MWRDLRFAMRRLLRSAGFSLTVILLLGLALGANACVFSVIYGLLYRPLPFADADSLVTVDVRLANIGIDVGLSVPFFETIQKKSQTLQGASAWRERQAQGLGDGAQAASYATVQAQPGVLSLLGTQPALGRLLQEEDAQAGAAGSVVISWDVWQSRYGGATNVLDQTLRLASGDYRIVGVLPRGFGFPHGTSQLWLPLRFTQAERDLSQAGSFGDLQAMARLRAGASPKAAQEEMAGMARELDELKSIIDMVGLRVAALPLRQLWVGERRPALQLMLLALGLVLLVTVANICNLYIARQLSRRQEMAVMDALGAGPWRRLRESLAETGVLTGVAACLGVGVIPLGLALLRRFDLMPADAPQEIGIDAVSVAFLFGLSLFLAAVMSASTMWLQRRNLALAVRGGGTRHTSGRAAQRARQALIVAQIGITAALLLGVGLLLRSSQRLLAEDVGFERDNLLISAISDLPHEEPNEIANESGNAPAEATMRVLLERLRALPGVAAVGLGNVAPFGWGMSVSNFALPGESNESDKKVGRTAHRARVNADYFKALRAPVVRGRDFTPEEAATQAPVAIVDTQFAQSVFGGRDPLGEIVRMSAGDNDPVLRDLRIVGVVPTLKLQALDEKADQPTVFQPMELPLNSMLLLRSAGDPAALAAPLKALFHEIAPRARLRDALSMRERIASTLSERTRLNALLELLGAMALALAGVGLYAVLAYSVRLRTAEFGVRMALGASAASVLTNVLRQGLRLVGTGVLLAIPLAYVLVQALHSRLFGVATFDPPTLAVVSLLLFAISVLACWLPARRAARVSPIEALRHE
jgi:predicted permease